MENSNIDFTFDESLTSREKQTLVQDLQNHIRKDLRRDKSLTVSDDDFLISKERPDTQDAGTILTILLNSAAIATLAKGVSSWLLKHREIELTVSKSDKESKVTAKNISSKDLKSIEELIGKVMHSDE